MSTDLPPRVHPAAQGFDTAAAAYERARPEYPAEPLRVLAGKLGLGPTSVVVDLAAGTGKLTRSLRAATELRLIAVEPSAGMRRAFLQAVPGVPILDGTAESIPLGDASVDAVVIGQAFHWFRPSEALAEIARVLRPQGGLGLVWNRRDERSGWPQRYGRILAEAKAGLEVPTAREATWRSAFDGPTPFGPLEEARFDSVQRLPPEDLVDRALSVSYIARMAPEGQVAIADRIRTFLRQERELAGAAVVDFPYLTEIYWTRRR